MARLRSYCYVVLFLLQLILTVLFIRNARETLGSEKVMRGCPVGWPLQTTTQDNGNISQVCRNQNGDWKCADGWQRFEEESRCINLVQPKVVKSIAQPQVTRTPNVIIRSSFLHPKYASVSYKRKLFFIHTPNTGNTIIETSFLFNDRRAELHGLFLGGDEKGIAFEKEFFKNFHKFSMIRHPCSQLISTWIYYSQGPENIEDRQWVAQHLDNRAMSSFNLFVTQTLYPEGNLKVTEQLYLQPQVNLIFDKQGKFALDQLLIFERWNESFDTLSERTGIDMYRLKASHKFPRQHADCQTVYTYKAWHKVAEIYAMDFCVLGYSSNMNKRQTIPQSISAQNILHNVIESALTNYTATKLGLSKENNSERA